MARDQALDEDERDGATPGSGLVVGWHPQLESLFAPTRGVVRDLDHSLDSLSKGEPDVNTESGGLHVVLQTPQARALLELGRRYFESGGEDQLQTIEPNYLRRASPEERVLAGEAAP
jgi:hypothetical protein